MRQFRIGGDVVRDFQITIKDQQFHVLARPLFRSGICVVQDVMGDADRELIGGLIMSRWLQPKKGRNERKIWVHYSEIFSHLRAIFHGIENYEQDTWGSLTTTRKAVQATVNLQAELLGLRTDNLLKRSPAVLREINMLLSALTGGRGDADIKKAVTQFLKIELQHDRLLRVNAPAMLARLMAARQKLIVPESAMIQRNAVFNYRRSVLKAVLAICELTIESALALCQQLAKDREAIEHRQDRRDLAVDMLLSYAMSFETIDVKPYMTTLGYTAAEFRRAAHMLQEQEYDTGYKILSTSESSFVLRNVRTDLERILFRLSRIVHLDHKRGLPNPRPEELERFQNAGKIIASLDTVNMQDFDSTEVEMLLNEVVEMYERKRYVAAYEGLKETVQRL